MSDRSPDAQRALRVYLVAEAASSLLFAVMTTLNLVYQVQVVGLTPLELVLVGTLLEGTCLLAEVPTGILADLRSRRLSVVIGFVLVGLGFSFEGAVPALWAVLAAQVVWGIGATFVSGAFEAWLVDEAGEDAAGRTFLRAAQLANAGALVGIALSVALGAVNVRIPIVAGGLGTAALGVALRLAMREDGFQPAARVAGEGRLPAGWRTARQGVRTARRRPVVRTLVLVSLCFGLASEGFDRLWTPHLLHDVHLPQVGRLGVVGWFGLASAVSLVLGIVLVEIARRRVRQEDDVHVLQALLLIDSLAVGCAVVFALARSLPLALGSYWGVRGLGSAQAPLTAAWLNRHVPSEVRATVLSLQSQANAAGQFMGGPAVGALATVVSLRAGLLASALLIAPALFLYLGLLRRLRTAGQPALDAA